MMLLRTSLILPRVLERTPQESCNLLVYFVSIQKGKRKLLKYRNNCVGNETHLR